MASKLPLNLRKNIRDYWETKQNDYLKPLNDVSGQTWKFEINFEDLFNKIDSGHYLKERLGEAAGWIVEGLIGNLERKMKDDMVKEAILDVCSKRVITLTIGEIKGSYFDVLIKDGGITIVYKKDNLATNVGDLGSSPNIEDQL